MKRISLILLAALLSLLLAACSSAVPATPAPAANSASAPAVGATPAGDSLVRTDAQASVTIDVTPLNLSDQSAATLEFKIVLNTHSVDLKYDYTSLATVSDDAGDKVQAVKWDGPVTGGHHVSGILSFPSLKNRGQTLTLTLRGIANVPERTFSWKVN